MQTFTANWRATDGVELFSQGWTPEGDPQAVVCLVHGLGEHSGRYTHVAQALTERGYAVHSFDLRGHGRSGGPRGHFPSPERVLEDLDLLLAEAERRFPGKPRFLYGHSLGGLLVLYYTLQRKPKLCGVVSTSPGLRTPLVEQKAKIMLARVLKSITPALGMPTGLDAADLCHDPQVVQAYREDALVHGLGTPGLANTSIAAIEYTFAHAAEFNLPLLLVHGTQDRITFARGSQEFAHRVGCDCTLKLWEGMVHETHNEPEKAAVLAYTLDWLDAHLPGASRSPAPTPVEEQTGG